MTFTLGRKVNAFEVALHVLSSFLVFPAPKETLMNPIRKAVIPVAGRGTRFLPATKAIPKEMLPVVDKPSIQYVVEEAVASDLQNILLVSSKGKHAIEDHFGPDGELETILRERGEEEALRDVSRISTLAAISSVRQKRLLGLGHAVLVTESFIGQEPFAVLLGDEIVDHAIPAIRQLIEAYQRVRSSIIGVQEVAWKSVSKYGVISVEAADETEEGRLFRVVGLVEKPCQEQAPSNLAIIGRYVLTPGIFEALKQTEPGVDAEIQLTDGLRRLAAQEPVYAYRVIGSRYDVGSKLGYLKATIALALKRTDVGKELRAYLEKLNL